MAELQGKRFSRMQALGCRLIIGLQAMMNTDYNVHLISLLITLWKQQVTFGKDMGKIYNIWPSYRRRQMTASIFAIYEEIPPLYQDCRCQKNACL